MKAYSNIGYPQQLMGALTRMASLQTRVARRAGFECSRGGKLAAPPSLGREDDVVQWINEAVSIWRGSECGFDFNHSVVRVDNAYTVPFINVSSVTLILAGFSVGKVCLLE